jgi:hypothetical protein
MRARRGWLGAGLVLGGVGSVWFGLGSQSHLTAAATDAGQALAAPPQAYTPPRTPDGQPDMQGHWSASPGGSYSVEDTGIQALGGGVLTPELAERIRTGKRTSRIVDPPDGRIPYQPWAAARAKVLFDQHLNPRPESVDAQARCMPGGIPREMYHLPYQILQAPGNVIILFEFAHAYHVIPLNAPAPLRENINLYMGDSRGRWEGNTLIVESTNFNDKNWFDIVGSFHSDALRVLERFTIIDADTINYEATIEDPKVLTRSWTMAFPMRRIKEQGYELMEHACHEGERDLRHSVR